MLHSFEWHACHFLLDVWLRLPWSGCPSFNISLLEWSLLMQPLTLTCLGLPGLATQSGRFLEKASGAYTCLSADTHKHEKWGLGRPDKLPTSPALWWLSMGETRWPSRRWEDKWKVRELSGDSTQSQCFLQTWRWTFILSPFIQSFSTTCVWMYKGHSDSKQSENCRHLYVCEHACVEQRRPAFQTAGKGLGDWNARHSLTSVWPLRLNPLPISVPHGSWSNWSPL